MSSTQQTYEIFVRATPEATWAAITQPESTERYFFGTRVEMALEPEGAVRYAGHGMTMVDGQVLAVEPGASLTTSWRVHYDPSCAGEESTVTWRVEPRGEATKLTVVHELAGAPNTAKNVGKDGWSLVLSGLKTLLETGAPLEVARG